MLPHCPTLLSRYFATAFFGQINDDDDNEVTKLQNKYRTILIIFS